MTCYDVFNGDADGICALQQLRLQFPREAERISGLKRDIDLVRRVDAGPGDEVTVLDVSLDKNRDAVEKALEMRRGNPNWKETYRSSTDEESAELVGISLATVKRDLRIAKAWLSSEMRGTGSGGSRSSERSP